VRRPVRWLAGLFLIPLVYLLAAVLGGLIPGSATQIPDDGRAEVEIGLIAGPIHYDFLLPATPATRAALGFAQHAGVPVDAPWAEHLLVGWGARGFYTTVGTYADITAGPVIRAITGDRAVMRVDVVGAIPANFAYPRLWLSAAQYAALLAGIAETATDTPLPGVRFTATDGFVEAAGRFHILRTCNTWVGRMLRQAGVRMGVWTPTPYALRLSLWRLGVTRLAAMNLD